MRIARGRPERIAGLIFQNFTISVEGWNPERLKVCERLSGPETPENLAEIEANSPPWTATCFFTRGARRPDELNPDYWAIDAYTFSMDASRVLMSKLFMTLATNIPLYPQWTAYLKDRQPKTLIVWGRNDPSYVRELAASCGLMGLAPHDLRRTCARLCHQSGGELEQIQFLLGHVSIETTERYLGCKQRFQNAVNDAIGLEGAS